MNLEKTTTFELYIETLNTTIELDVHAYVDDLEDLDVDGLVVQYNSVLVEVFDVVYCGVSIPADSPLFIEVKNYVEENAWEEFEDLLF